MARWEFKLPDIGEGVAEGELVAWGEGVAIGATVKVDQLLCEVTTDKATAAITSPKGGKVLELGGKVGEIIRVHSMLVVLELDGDASTEPLPASAARPSPASAGPAPSAPAKPEPAATAVGDIQETLPGVARLAQPRAPASPASVATSAYFSEKPLATPATRKLARELGVDLRTVAPTGPNGRATSDDVRRSLTAAPAAAPSEPAGASAPSPVASTAPPAAGALAPIKIATPVGVAEDVEERTPLKGVRKKIFESMARSKHTAAHFTFVEECDVSALKALRQRLRPAAEEAGVKLTFLPFIVKAVVAALRKHPSLNSAFDESTSEIVRRKVYHIGIASSTDAGLMVPVVKHADRLSILEIAREIQRLGEATKAGKQRIEDLQGSTFTITSLGAEGGLFATPILNFPEVGILGVHQIKQKPVVRDGQIVIGEVMLLSLSFDHRIIDGHVGAAFAYEIIHYLEDPDRLFLEMA